jgi:MSHA biogenesis protein MshQ
MALLGLCLGVLSRPSIGSEISELFDNGIVTIESGTTETVTFNAAGQLIDGSSEYLNADNVPHPNYSNVSGYVSCDAQGVKCSSTSDYQPKDALTLPTCSSDVSSGSNTVNSDSSVTYSHGSYSSIQLNANGTVYFDSDSNGDVYTFDTLGLDGTVYLGPGTYWVGDLTVNSAANLVFPTDTTEQVKFFVSGNLNLNRSLKPSRSSQLVLASTSGNSLNLKYDVTGFVYSTGDLKLESGNSGSAVEVIGGVAGKTVELGTYTSVTYEPYEVASIYWNASCDDTSGYDDLELKFGRITNTSTTSVTPSTSAITTVASGSVTFDAEFSETPLVFLMPTIEYDSSDDDVIEDDGPASVVLTAISTTGFSWAQRQPPCKSGFCTASVPMSSIDWIAIPPGQYEFDDGTTMVAGSVGIDDYIYKSNTDNWVDTGVDSEDYEVVINQRQVGTSSCWATSVSRGTNDDDVDNIELALDLSSTYGFCSTLSGSESVAYLATQDSDGEMTLDGSTYEYDFDSGETTDDSGEESLKEQCEDTSNLEDFSNKAAPYLVASKSSQNDESEGGFVRRCQITYDDFSVVTDEDQYKKKDRKHKAEVTNFMAFESVEASSVTSSMDLSGSSYGLTCSAYILTISLSNSDGSTYTGDISISTSTGSGTWSLSDAENSSSFSAGSDDGSASYTFVTADDGSIELSLDYTAAESVTITVTDDDDNSVTATQTVTFSPYGFTVSADSPQTANNPFGLTIKAVAKDTTTNAAQCAVIDEYTGDQTLNIAISYDDPSSCYDSGTSGCDTPVQVDISGDGYNDLPLSSQTVSFSDGISTALTANYKDAGQITFTLTDSSYSADQTLTGEVTVIVNPSTFRLPDAALTNSDDTENPNGSATSGDAFTTAGSTFSAKAYALMANCSVTNSSTVDAIEDCVTPNFQGDIALTAALDTPTSGNGGTLGTVGGTLTQTASGGIASFSDLTYSEVGSITLTPSNKDYIESDNDISGTTSDAVGRFIPASFVITGGSVDPSSSSSTSPSNCGSFFYLDAPHIAVTDMTIEARNELGSVTTNYDSDGYTVSTGLNWQLFDGTTDYSDFLGETSSQTYSWSSGILSVTVEDLQLSRYLSSSSQISETSTPLENTTMGVTISDNSLGDSVAMAGTSSCSDCGGFIPDGSSALALAPFYYGRLKMVNGYGSELTSTDVDLPIQYYDGSSFVTNTADSCSVFTNSVSLLDDDSGATDSVYDALGCSSHINGSVTINNDSDLASSGEVSLTFTNDSSDKSVGCYIYQVDYTDIPWLKYNWDEDTDGELDDTTDGSVTFGVFRNSDRVIYQRDIYK